MKTPGAPTGDFRQALVVDRDYPFPPRLRRPAVRRHWKAHPPQWDARLRVGRPRCWHHPYWSPRLVDDIALVDGLKPAPMPHPTAPAHPALDFDALDQSLATAIRDWMAYWPALSEFVRLVPTPTALTVGEHTPERVTVPLLLWVSRLPIGVPQEQRLAYYLARAWKTPSMWQHTCRLVMGYEAPTADPATGLLSPPRWREPEALWRIMRQGIIRFLWAEWTPEAGWRLSGFPSNGRRLTHPTERDLKAFVRGQFSLEPTTSATLETPVFEGEAIPWAVWLVLFGASFALAVVVPAWQKFFWMPVVLGYGLLSWLPDRLAHARYRQWRQWLKTFAAL